MYIVLQLEVGMYTQYGLLEPKYTVPYCMFYGFQCRFNAINVNVNHINHFPNLYTLFVLTLCLESCGQCQSLKSKFNPRRCAMYHNLHCANQRTNCGVGCR